MKKYISLILIPILISACPESVCLAASGEQKVASEEYAVYSALIVALMEKKHSRGPIEMVVINQQTTSIKEPHYLSGMSLKETYDDYKSKNVQSHPLENLFDLRFYLHPYFSPYAHPRLNTSLVNDNLKSAVRICGVLWL